MWPIVVMLALAAGPEAAPAHGEGIAVRDPSAGFGTCSASVDLRIVPGDHLTMLTRHAPALAAAIAEALRSAEGASP